MNSMVLIESVPLLMQGMLMTLKLWIGAAAVALSCGIIWGILRTDRIRIVCISPMLDAITFILRGIPFYVQLLIAYYVLPDLFQVSISPEMAGIISLGLCSAAYVSQMVRAAVNAIAGEQWEAAWVLGFSMIQTVWYVIMPQVLRIVIPMIAGELDQLLKSTSIIATIGVVELTRAGMNIVAREMQVVPVYLTVACAYLLISSVLHGISVIVERRYLYDSC